MLKSQVLGSTVLELVGASDANLNLLFRIAQALNRRNSDATLRAEVLSQALTAPLRLSNIIPLDNPGGLFSPADFDPKLVGWTSANDFDSRLLSVTQVDMSDLVRVDMLKVGEVSITGEERLKRMLETGHRGFDLRIMYVLWRDYLICKASDGDIAGSLLERVFQETGIDFIDVMGQPLLSPGGRAIALESLPTFIQTL